MLHRERPRRARRVDGRPRRRSARWSPSPRSLDLARTRLLAALRRARRATARCAATATVGGNLCAPPGSDVPARRPRRAADRARRARALDRRAAASARSRSRTSSPATAAGRLVLEIEYDRFAGATGVERDAPPPRALVRGRRRRRVRRAPTAATCASPSPASGRRAVRCRAVEASRDADDVLEDVEPGRRRRRLGRLPRARSCPLLVREALDQLERA